MQPGYSDGGKLEELKEQTPSQVKRENEEKHSVVTSLQRAAQALPVGKDRVPWPSGGGSGSVVSESHPCPLCSVATEAP